MEQQVIEQEGLPYEAFVRETLRERLDFDLSRIDNNDDLTIDSMGLLELLL